MRSLKIIRDLLLVIVAIGSCLGAILAIHVQAGFLTITSRSMEPTIKAGDMVLTRLTPIDDISVRDIVVLPIPENPSISYSHRVVAVSNSGKGVSIKTKGDSNPNPDSWDLEVTSKKVTQVLAIIPTSRVFNGPIERQWIFYSLFYGGALLGLFGAWRLVRR